MNRPTRSHPRSFLFGAAAVGLAWAFLGLQSVGTSVPIDCLPTIADGAVPGGCLGASSSPALGALFPLSSELNVSPSGRVGMGTTSPVAGLDVVAQNSGDDGVRAVGADDGAGIGGEGIRAVGGRGGQGGGSGVVAFGGGSFGAGGGAPAIIGTAGPFPAGPAPGIVGRGASTDGQGVAETGVVGLGGGGAKFGIQGGAGVLGIGGAATGPGGDGVLGIAGSGIPGMPGIAVRAEGDLVVSGAKMFAQPHPKDPSQEIRFVCLEGNESGTYFRGSSALVDGRVSIPVPEEFRLVTAARGLTVQLTARGPQAGLWIVSSDLNEIVVSGEADVPFDYFVNGVRRGFEDYVPVRPNVSFVPKYADEPFGGQYPEGLRALLVENGTLQADHTPNPGTAARLGWRLQASHEVPTWLRPDEPR